jgi:hypothetical protein
MSEESTNQPQRHALSPDPSIHKVLISSPVEFSGRYEGENRKSLSMYC